MQKRYLVGVIVGAACLSCLPVHAQFASLDGTQNGTTQNTQNTQNNGRGGRNGGAVLPLPKGVTRVISVDSQNMLLVEMDDPDDPTQKQYASIPIQHVYSGGIARLFGGTIITTEELVSPGYSQNNGNGSNGNGGFPGPSAYSNNGGGGGIGFFNPTQGGTTGNSNGGTSYAPGNQGITGGYLNGYTPNPGGQSFSSPYTFANPSYNPNFLNTPLRIRSVRRQPTLAGQVPQPAPSG